MQDLTGVLVLWGIRVLSIVILTPLIVLVAGHLIGVEKASLVRSIAIAIFGLLLFVLLMLPVAANLAHTLGMQLPIDVPGFINLPITQLLAIYLVAWILLIKFGFESTFLDAFAVGVSSAVLLLIIGTIVLFLTSLPFTI